MPKNDSIHAYIRSRLCLRLFPFVPTFFSKGSMLFRQRVRAFLHRTALFTSFIVSL